jgi:RNA polymerase sigma-70 factor (ECF subfamily)
MRATETDRFEAVTAPLRRELFAHCYRMTGSVHDAEDLVQETYVRAWRAFDRFEDRSSVRTWMYRIATNVCLTAIDRGRRRALPSGLGAPATDPFAPATMASEDVLWLEPIPDRFVVDELGDPAEVVAMRQGVRLALIAGLQLLPLRQRVALILCDVLAWPAADAAELLDVSVVAVKSLLQRARARLADVSASDDNLAEPTDAGARRIVDRYVAAFEQSDMAAIERLLADDAVLEIAGSTTWFSGKATCVPYIAAQAIGYEGEWRIVPIGANGQLAGAAYRRGDDGAYHAFAIVVLATTSVHLTRISLFADVGLFAYFELPPTTV